MAAAIHMLPRDERLDPLSLTSILEWVERTRPHRPSRKRPAARAEALAELVQALWPGIDQTSGSRALTLQAPDAPFSVDLGEDRATVSVLREPGELELRFADTIVQAICRQAGWIAYDPRQQDIVAGVQWRCPTCERWLAVRHVACPSCGGASSDGSVGWAEPTPALFSASSDAGLDLRPLVGPCGIPARMLTDPVLAPIEAELTRVACEASEGRTPLEVSIDRPNDDLVRAIFDPIDTELARRGDQEPAPLALPPLFGDLPSIHLRVMQCVTVVETVTHPEREVSRDAVAAELDDVEAGDELLFAVAFTPAMRACLAGDEGRYGFLPSPRWQPGLARPLWAALRSMLQAVAAEARRSGS